MLRSVVQVYPWLPYIKDLPGNWWVFFLCVNSVHHSVQSLLTACRLHDINPYIYLVDVLQRVSQHPADRVEELTPRLWKKHFVDHPLQSDLGLI